MADQNELENLMAQINMYKSQGEIVQQQVETIQASLTEVEVLEETLNDVKGKGSLKTLVPVGAGSFMNAEISNTEDIIMSVGAGVAIKKNIDDAKETITQQKKELTQSLENMLNNLEKINQVISQLSPRAEELMMQAQAAQQSPIT
jgi:prefoldin alpha subunit